MLNSYELVLVFSPVMSKDEVKQSIKKYKKLVNTVGGELVHEDFWGLKQLAYPIKKKTTGIYLVLEFSAPGDAINKMEVLFKRDENILRFLTIRLDKYAVEYNRKKKLGLVGRNKKKSVEEEAAAK